MSSEVGADHLRRTAQEAEGVGYRFGDTQHPPLSAVSMLASLLVQVVICERPHVRSSTLSFIHDVTRKPIAYIDCDDAVGHGV